MKKTKLIIIQPCIARYRISFFNDLSKKEGIDLKVISSEKDECGLKSDKTGDFNFRTDIKLIALFKKKIILQRNIFQNDIRHSDIITVTGNPRYISFIPLYIYCKITGKKIIWWGQGWSSKTNKYTYLIRRAIMSLFDGTLVYTEQEAIEINKLRIKPNILHYLDNGLDVNNINNVLGKISLKKKPENGVLNLIFIGRLTEKSNILFILNTLLNLDCHIDIIGDGMLKSSVQELSNEYPEKITYIGAIHNEEEIAPYMMKSHYFIYGGDVGLSLIHAFSYGLPAIIHSSYKEHMPEISAFKENETGFVFKKNNSQSLLMTLNELPKSDSNEYIKMSNQCKETTKNKFNTQKMADNFVYLIEKINNKGNDL
ncbi:glycosyltransferase [Providencia alcalifaciens]|uniref:glycosyltransferase n=1 Tax=Providencia alcalifaciens TaxID=126385 RepID=UPI003D96EDD1